VLGALIAELEQIKTREKNPTFTEQDRRDRQMQLVGSTRPAGIEHRRDTATDAHVPALRGLVRATQRRVDSIGHEVKRGAARHHERGARVPLRLL
jgi:hypothetical protein